MVYCIDTTLHVRGTWDFTIDLQSRKRRVLQKAFPPSRNLDTELSQMKRETGMNSVLFKTGKQWLLKKSICT